MMKNYYEETKLLLMEELKDLNILKQDKDISEAEFDANYKALLVVSEFSDKYFKANLKAYNNVEEKAFDEFSFDKMREHLKFYVNNIMNDNLLGIDPTKAPNKKKVNNYVNLLDQI